MRRREFLTFLGGAAAGWPLAAHAQQAAMLPIIGFLGSEKPDVFAARLRGFRQGLSEMGYVEGRNVAIVFQWAGGNSDLFPTLAEELVRERVSVLVAGDGPSVRAAKAATTTIPIVFYTGGDPVGQGLVANLARPGGNLTGIAALSVELQPKRLELLRDILPAANSVALLLNSSSLPLPLSMKGIQDSAQALGVTLHNVHAAKEREFDGAFRKVLELRAAGLIIFPDPLFQGRGEQLGTLSLQYRVPAIGLYPDFTAAGGLMSYGGNLNDMFRLVGVYTGRILNGERPVDLPVQQATKVRLTLNLKTAKVLGLTVPLSLLAHADEVIE
jgi:putative tryptophan/tyrosine transport system substrate-binding protein